MKGGFLLDVVVAEGTAVLELLASEDQPLLVWGDSLLVLDLSFNVLDGIRRLDLEGDGLAGQGLHEDLHTSPKPEHEMECALFLNVVVAEGTSVLELLSSEDQPLLIWGDSLLILDFCFDILDGIRRLDLKGDGLAGQGLHEDLHTSTETEYQVECALFLNVVIGQRTSILELLSSEDQSL